jgi:tRNA A37 threonylcarbamoyladenosine dehydratase
MEQFLCIELLLGKEKLRKLHDSFVTVIGLGAVGSYTVEALARAGVGRLRLVDFDVIKPTNINRHIYALHSTMGKHKVALGRQRIHDINPDCKVEALELFAADDSMDRIFSETPNLVIDAIDSMTPKAQVLAACQRRGIPVISSMGAAMRTDPFKIKTADLFDTKGCPLAQNMRQKLRKEKVGRGIFCVYSDETKRRAFAPPEIAEAEMTFDRGRKRNKLGSLPTITGIFGLVVAHCAIEYLCGGYKN